MPDFDGVITLELPETPPGTLPSAAGVVLRDYATGQPIVTATDMVLHFGFTEGGGVWASVTELAEPDGSPLRQQAAKELILESRAYTTEYREWLAGDKETDFEGEVFNYRTFRYQVAGLHGEVASGT